MKWIWIVCSLWMTSAQAFYSKESTEAVLSFSHHVTIKSKTRPTREKAQEEIGLTPAYRTVRENGPDHDKQFTVAVFVGEECVAKGSGKSKQEAEQDAARNGLTAKGW